MKQISIIFRFCSIYFVKLSRPHNHAAGKTLYTALKVLFVCITGIFWGNSLLSMFFQMRVHHWRLKFLDVWTVVDDFCSFWHYWWPLIDWLHEGFQSSFDYESLTCSFYLTIETNHTNVQKDIWILKSFLSGTY